MSSRPAFARALGYATFALFAALAVITAAVALGVFDPQPPGPLRVTRAPGGWTVGADSAEWLPDPLPPVAGVHLDAAWRSGELDSGFGLLWGTPQAHLGVAVSPLGYVAVWEERDGARRDHLPWQTWPHVRPGRSGNEIWLDRHADGLTVRVNREILWRAAGDALPPCDPCAVALWGTTFGGPAEIVFERLALYYE